MTVALIDADSIYYVLAHQFRDRVQDVEQVLGEMSKQQVICDATIKLDSEVAMEMHGAVDQFIIGILQACGATHYLGAIGDKQRCFRHKVAKFKPYKGSRPESPPWFTLWKPIIEERFRTEWGFVSVPGLEADDIIAFWWEIGVQLSETSSHLPNPDQVIICSPDKDLRQFPGKFFDYKKIDFADVSQDEAEYNFAFQMIAGDSGDNVSGVPGAGEKKAKEKLKECKDASMFYDQMVRRMYYKHFGDYYGDIIYLENHAVLSMITSKHPYYEDYVEELNKLQLHPVPEGIGTDTATTEKLKALGWG